MKMKRGKMIGVLLAGIFSAALIFSTAEAQRPVPAPGNPTQAQTNKKTSPALGAPAGVQADGGIAVDETVPVAAKKPKNNQGQVNAENHRSTVATFVQSLLAVADRESGIGEQVRAVAQAQNDSKENVAKEIEAVQSRSTLKTFFLGSDFKNLGALRSEMVKTRNEIDQLIRLSEKTENPESKTELQNQIIALQVEQAKIQTFVTANEQEFGVIGWITRMFQ
jgi:hypothetical protein